MLCYTILICCCRLQTCYYSGVSWHAEAAGSVRHSSAGAWATEHCGCKETAVLVAIEAVASRHH
jgi:hypothetical protein